MRNLFLKLLFIFSLSNHLLFGFNAKGNFPNISFDLFSGEVVNIDDLVKQGPLIIQFWAMWCSPCKKEMFYLNKIQNKYKDSGLNIICINTDNLKSLSKAKAYIRQKKYNLIVATDPNSQIFKKLNANVMPTTIVIHNNEIIYQKEGYFSGDEKKVEELVKSLILF